MLLDIKVTGLNQAIRQLENYTNNIEHKLTTLVERLLDEGFDVAEALFAKALYAGTNDVTVLYPYWEGDTMVLAADGKAVAFIEFGTGSNYYDYPDQTVYANNPSLAGHGQYGKGHGKDIRWWYKGEPGTAGRPKRLPDGSYSTVWSTSWGNPPARAMYEASKKLDKEHVLEVAREVFTQ